MDDCHQLMDVILSDEKELLLDIKLEEGEGVI